ncbi:MAG TPA: polyamine aminopropyltransferase [Bdellovibrionales bacterium]|nr:polyamine aminopropyltransferase [Bdellovibrionales bacterium]
MSWIEEEYKEGMKFGFRRAREEPLFKTRSDFQKIEIDETTHHGRVLLNDDCFMLSERDERIYHEMMAHVPLGAHGSAKRVLIIGGGDGGTAREVLRHPQVERCVMVEIDAMVVEASRKFLPQTAAALGDSRLELRIEDGVAYMKSATEEFDVILIDSTDPNGAAEPLFGAEFYGDVSRRLAPKGVVVAQGESVFYEAETQSRLLEIAHPLFDWVSMFNFTNMTYPGGLWSFMWASRQVHPLAEVNAPSGISTFYYNVEVHRAAFRLPQFQLENLRSWIKI